MTSQGTAHGRFTRAIGTRNLWAAETAMRELGNVSLLDALEYLELLATQRPDRFDRAAVRWHGRLETEARTLTVADSQLALAALGSIRAGDLSAIDVLRRLLRRVQPRSRVASRHDPFPDTLAWVTSGDNAPHSAQMGNAERGAREGALSVWAYTSSWWQRQKTPGTSPG